MHINSGIPNHAFYLIATRLRGYSWEKAGQIWHTDGHFTVQCNFAEFASATIAMAQPYGAEVVTAVEHA